MSGYCRSCFTPAQGQETQCKTCGRRPILRHSELDTLSIAHIDCDAFYASIEKRDNPELADQPVIIGGGQRGVVATACYVARLFGVHSAMPMFKAKKACPDAVIIKPRMSVYAAEGKRIKSMMSDLTPLVEPLSIDEAFLDLSGTQRLHHASPALSLLRLQNQIRDEVGVTVSVGLSFNKFLAKTASDLDKPNGFSIIGRAEAPAFLARLPVSAVYGVGPVLAQKLINDGIRTLGKVREYDDSYMAKRYGESGLRLACLSRGEDARQVQSRPERKSVSKETTFNSDINDKAELKNQLWRLCQQVADQMKDKGIGGRVITLKLKTDRFKTITRRRTLAEHTQLADALFRVTSELLDREPDGVRYRLIGAGFSDLVRFEQGGVGDLLDPDAQKREKAERAMDAARAKFGDTAIIKGRQLKN